MARTIQVRLQDAGTRQTRIIEGVGSFMGMMGDWLVPCQPWRTVARKQDLSVVRCDGAIVDSLAPYELGKKLPFPVVLISGREQKVPYHRVMLDNIAAGRAVARALLETGLRHFAYVALPGMWFSDLRKQAFVETIEQAGRHCDVFDPVDIIGQPDGWSKASDAMGNFIKSLPKPAAVMAANDERAVHLADSARARGLRVPDDLAIAGVDNDTAMCLFGQVPLSSLDDNAFRIGYEAAAMLARLMDGEKDLPPEVLIQPGRFVARQSTDVIAASDPAVAKAIRYIRDHACDGIDVEQVISAAGLSRSSLQRGLRAAIGRTPGAEIRRVRIERARQLLAESDWSIKRIAIATGHRDGRHLSQVFAEQLGVTPSQFRLAERREQTRPT